ncbi:MAG: hypothetical protein OEV23_02820 [Gallionella sp.]|nr:hypothetical protein [Gallionella sp.]
MILFVTSYYQFLYFALELMRINAGALSHALLRIAGMRKFLDVLHQL